MLKNAGFIDLIVQRKDLNKKIGSLLSILLKKNSDISSVSNEASEDIAQITKTAS